MLIATAINLTPNLQRLNGTADYDVWVGINQHCIWRGNVNNHQRDSGAAALLRRIAERMEEKK